MGQLGEQVTTLAWIVLLGLAMSGIAMVGSITLILTEEALDRLLIPLVALAAGSLLGGAFFHMLPNAIDELGNTKPSGCGSLLASPGSSCWSRPCIGTTVTGQYRSTARWAT